MPRTRGTPWRWRTSRSTTWTPPTRSTSARWTPSASAGSGGRRCTWLRIGPRRCGPPVAGSAPTRCSSRRRRTASACRAPARSSRALRRPAAHRLARTLEPNKEAHMAWGFIGELPISRDEYDRLNAEISEDPEGLILHTAAEHGDGMRIIDVWESEAAYRRFEEEILMPAM